MPTRYKNNRIDNEEKNDTDPERGLKRDHLKQLETDNVSTYDIENPNCTD